MSIPTAFQQHKIPSFFTQFLLKWAKKLSNELVFILANGTLEILEKKLNFNDLVKKVASKNGTTEKALNFLKKEKFSLLVSQAISKAEKRSREIAKDLL